MIILLVTEDNDVVKISPCKQFEACKDFSYKSLEGSRGILKTKDQISIDVDRMG